MDTGADRERDADGGDDRLSLVEGLDPDLYPDLVWIDIA
jgi:hypothetical protein